MRQERLKRRILEDIQRQLVLLLAARGVSASLELTHAEAIVWGPMGKSQVKLGELPSQWRQLTPQQRTSRLAPIVDELVRRLPAAPPHRRWSITAPLLALLVLTGGLGAAVVRDLMLHRQSLANENAGLSQADADRLRAQRVCEATRSRVMRGGTAGPVDYEGWVVELLLVGAAPNPDAGASAAWQRLFSTAGNRLLVLDAPATLTEAGEGHAQLLEHADGGQRELRFVLEEGYARAYFDELGRREWVKLAATLFEATHSRYGALVARCAHLNSHHIGAWFAGDSAPAAAAALLHYAGVYSETPVFTRDYLPDNPAARPALDLLALFEKRTRELDRTQLAMWLSPEQGMVSGRPDAGLSLEFPYRDSNRASRASLRLARRLGIANSR